MAETQHKPKQILQDGATNANNVIKWSGTAWAPAILDSTNISDFIEAAQDAVGAMLDANSLEYTDATPLLAVKRQFTITADASGLKLVNDSASPGNNKIYGTNASGVKGWYDSPSGADGNGIYTGSGNVGQGANNVTATIPTAKGLNFQFSNNSAFNVLYQGGATALGIGDNDSVLIKSDNGTNAVFITDASLALTSGAGTLDLGSSEFNINGAPFLWNDSLDTDPIDDKAAFEIRSTDKVFFPPRMDTTAQTDLGAVNDAGILYNTTTDTLNIRINGSWKEILTQGGIPSVTASNGLTKVGDDIQLGGTLTNNTTIDNGNNFKLAVNGQLAGGNNYIFNVGNTHASGGGLQSVTSGTGAAIQGLANGTGTGVSGYAVGGGSGITGQSETGGIAGWFTTEDTSNNSVITGLSVFRNVTGGAGADNLGVRLELGAETTTTSNRRANSIISTWTTAADLTRTSNFAITTVNSGTEATKLELAGTGKLRFNSYGGGTFNGTPTKYLQVDTNGFVIEGALTGTGGIYSGSGTIPNDTVATLTLNGDFTIDYNGGNDGFRIDDLTSSMLLKSKDGTSQVSINNTAASLATTENSASIVAAASELSMTYKEGDPAQQKFVVDSTGAYFTSTTKMFIPPVMTTAQRTAGTLTETGGIVYDSDFQRIFLKVPIGFKQLLVDGSGEGGIYGGSGNIPNGTNATVANNGTFGILYNNGNTAFNVLDSASTTGIYSKDATTSVKAANGTADMLVSGVGFIVNGTRSKATNILDAAKTIEYTVTLTPAQITANQNNYAPANHDTSSTWNISSDAARNITGIANPTAGRILILHNTGTFTITLKNEDAASNATNRFSLGADIPIPAKASVHLIYDGSNGRWKCVGGGLATPHSGSGGIYGGDGTIASGCDATVTDGSYFRIKYSTGGNGAITVNSTSGSENTKIEGKGSDRGKLEVNNTQAILSGGSSGEGIVVSELKTNLASRYTIIEQKTYLIGVDTPAAFSTTQNDYDIDANMYVTRIRMETTIDNTQVTGFAHGEGIGNFADADGRVVIVHNISGTTGIRFMGNNPGSQAEYRFIATMTLPATETAMFIYDATSQRWRHFK